MKLLSKEKCKHQNKHKPLLYNGVLPARCVSKTYVSNKAIIDLTYDPFHKMEPTASNTWVTKNLTLDTPGS